MKRSQAPSQIAKRGAQKQARKETSSFRLPRGIGRTSVGFPKQLRMKQRFVVPFNVTTGAGSISTIQVSCNGLYDPSSSFAGHQPMYFDTLATLYNHYTCLNSKITVQCYATSTYGILAGVYIEDDTTRTPTFSGAASEQNSSSYGLVAPGGAGGNVVTFRKSWSATEAFGANPLSNDNLQGTVAANPTEQQHYTIFAQHVDQTQIVAISGVLTVEYDAVWDELKNLNTN